MRIPTLQRYLTRQIWGAITFVLVGFLALFAFFDLIAELRRSRTRRSSGWGGGSSFGSPATRMRQVEQRPRPPQTDACAMPA